MAIPKPNPDDRCEHGMSEIEKDAAEMAAGLRAIAVMIEENPEVTAHFTTSLFTSGIKMHTNSGDVAAELAHIARVGLRHGATVSKDIDETWHNVVLHFGRVKAKVLAYRQEVCERVQVGEKAVTKTVPDPSATVPMVEVTETVPVYEYKCRPLLAAEGGVSA